MPDNAYFEGKPCVPDSSVCGAKARGKLVNPPREVQGGAFCQHRRPFGTKWTVSRWKMWKMVYKMWLQMVYQMENGSTPS